MSFNREDTFFDKARVNQLFTQGAVAAADLAATASQEYPLGTRRIVGSAEYVYVQADGVLAANSWATIAATGEAAPLDTDVAATILVGRPVGIAQGAFADNEFGWLAVFGLGITGLSADATAGVRVVATSSAGIVDDTASAETGIVKAAALDTTVSGGAGSGPFTLRYPFIDTDLDT